MPDRDLNAMLDRQARQQPQAVAFRDPQRSWTFEQVQQASLRIGQGLRAAGIGPGERVACLTRHVVECTLLTLGAARIGAVCMPVNWRLAPNEVAYILANGGARFLMTDALFADTARQAAPPGLLTMVATDEGSTLTGFGDWYGAYPALDAGVETDPDATALQLYSSGTTGQPKGVEISHRNITINTEQTGSEIGFDGPAHVMFNALPPFHIAGVGLTLLTLGRGGQSVCMPEFDPPRIIEGIAQHRITHLFLVPAMILALISTPGVEAGDYSSVQSISYGASPISESVLREATRVFGCGFTQLYGLTETTGAIVYLPPEDHDPQGPKAHLMRAAGRAGRLVGLRIVDAATGVDLPEGEVGEVWIRSPQNMRGYWDNPAATEQAFPQGRDAQGGWFRSGDAGCLREGYLYIRDRIKDMIISGGENIYPAEVENTLMKHPAVADGAIIGVPDDKWGESVKACVVLRPGAQATERDIIDFMRREIAHFKCPKSVDFRTELPRNPSGKLLKYVLREPYWAGRDRAVG
ncbi:MAG: long-chain-fatty-acid--CoA ligase [Burkholderiales bacterium]|nr:long-chain-fatty-acid--CoA ligase [Burkholderiales bacterium]